MVGVLPTMVGVIATMVGVVPPQALALSSSLSLLLVPTYRPCHYPCPFCPPSFPTRAPPLATSSRTRTFGVRDPHVRIDRVEGRG